MVAAREALEELTSAGVYRTAKIDKGKTVASVAHAVLDSADDVAARNPLPAPSERVRDAAAGSAEGGSGRD